jgi:hypothetical protein
MRFGAQVDIQGIIAPSPDADRAIRYLTKYLTKSVAQTFTSPGQVDRAYERHIDRLHAHVRWLPCSGACANWLVYAGCSPRTPAPTWSPAGVPHGRTTGTTSASAAAGSR